MKTHKLALALLLLALVATSISCAASQSTDEVETSPVRTLDELITALHNNGATVESLDTISQPFFAPEGQVISVNGFQVQVFEYPNEEDTSSAAGTISSDGSSVGTTMVSWVEPPHFFKSGNLIVLYVGEESSILEALHEILGPQIAGR